MENSTKKVNMVTYKLKGDIFYTETSNYDSIDRVTSKDYFYQLTDSLRVEMDRLGSTGLAQYLDEPLKDIIDSIVVGCELDGQSTYSITKIVANKELTLKEKKELRDYIIGQFSDGFGEGFEQQELTTFTSEEEYYEYDEDEEEEESYYEDVEYSVYANLWTNTSDYTWVQ